MKKFFFIFLILSSIAATSSGQNLMMIDSLRKQFKSVTPQQKFELMNAIGFEYRYSFPDSTILYCTRAYELGKSLHLKKELSKPLSFIGLASANKGDFKQSVKYHYESIEVAINQNDSVQLAFGYNNLGRMFFDEGDLARAYTNLSRSRELFEMLNNPSGLAYVFRSLANIYKSQHDYGQALEMSERALALRKQLGDPRGIVSALVELGLVYEALNNGDKALAKFNMADSMAARIHDKVSQIEVKLGKAEILFKQKKYEEAYVTANDVLHIISSQTNQKLFLRANLIRGNYFFEKHSYLQAIPILDRIVKEADNNLSFKRDACFLLAEIYKTVKNTAKAEEYNKEWKFLDERLQNTNLTLQVNQLQFKLDLERIEKENEILKYNQAKDRAFIVTQRNRNILLLITVISVTTAFFVVWIQGRRRKAIHEKIELANLQIKNQGEEIETKNRDLSHRNEELSALNYEKDTLMNIVAHDLKSPINHILGLSQIMEMEGGLTDTQRNYVRLIKEATSSGLNLIVDLLDVNALQEVREAVNYTAFDWLTLTQEQVRSFESEAHAKRINLNFRNNGTATVFSEPQYLSRIFDNLISNAIKFSPRGSAVEIATEVGNGKLHIKISDQGPGFSEEDKKFIFQRFKKLSARPTAGESSNGLGLTIVKTLVDRLNGHIELASNSPHGSIFIVTIPAKIAEKAAL